MINSRALMYETWIWTKSLNWQYNRISDMWHMCPLTQQWWQMKVHWRVGNSPCPKVLGVAENRRCKDWSPFWRICLYYLSPINSIIRLYETVNTCAYVAWLAPAFTSGPLINLYAHTRTRCACTQTTLWTQWGRAGLLQRCRNAGPNNRTATTDISRLSCTGLCMRPRRQTGLMPDKSAARLALLYHLED